MVPACADAAPQPDFRLRGAVLAAACAMAYGGAPSEAAGYDPESAVEVFGAARARSFRERFHLLSDADLATRLTHGRMPSRRAGATWQSSGRNATPSIWTRTT